MPIGVRDLRRPVLWMCLSVAAGVSAFAQSPPEADPGVVPDDMLTLVVGTRFVSPSSADQSAKALFDAARIPLSSFNETDHCLDKTALEIAQEYFAGLGRALGKAAYYYFIPDAEIKEAVSRCEKMSGQPPQAWAETKTKIIAFGKVVPTADAPALEKAIR